MSLFSFVRKLIHSNCKKSKDRSIPKEPYKDGKYKVSKHAVERMNERQITKGEVHYNLHTKPIYKTKASLDRAGRFAYVRYSKNKTRTVINPKSKKVASVRRYRNKELEKEKRGKKMMKKYSKEVDDFIRMEILPKLGLNDYSNDNIDDILNFISSRYEDPLCNASESGDILSDDDKELLRLATKSITEITTREDWDN